MSPLQITDLDLQTNGIAHNKNDQYRIPFTLPGEICEEQIISKKGNTVFVLPTEIIHASPDRISPDCIHFGSCSACHLRHVTYEKSLEIKIKVFQEAAKQHFSTSSHHQEKIAQITICKAPNPFYYRNTARFDVCNGVIMYHEMLSHKLLPLSSCKTISSSMNTVITQLQGTIPPHITEIEMKENDKREMMVIFGGTQMSSLPRLPVHSTYFYNTTNKIITHIAGERTVKHTLHISGHAFLFHVGPQSFFQVHTAMAELLFGHVQAWIPDHGNLLDLYAGTGTIGIIAAGLHPNLSVTGYEFNEEMVQLGSQNADINNLKNFSLLQADVRTLRFQECPDVIIVDPPRKGLSRESLIHLISLGAKKIIYISCHAESFLRDIQLFPSTYHLSSLELFDMTPFTSHMEIVGVWEKQE